MERRKFQLEFTMNNDAFTEDNETVEVPRILYIVGESFQLGRDNGNIYDMNGNTIGHWSVAKS